MTHLLKPCPFCGGIARIGKHDDEGTIHIDDYYEFFPEVWYYISHSLEENKNCPIATHEMYGEKIGSCSYGSIEKLIESWNKRIND